MVRRLPVWERDVAEAKTVTAKSSGHQFEIQLGHLCNERCVFCSSGQLSALKLARAIPLAPIIEAIERARAGGARRITFLGGEPTLHKGFTAALARAVELGFEEIVIFTNGVLLPHPGFVERIAALGRFEWRVSIQGGDEASHVAVTKRADSFARIVEGLRILRALGQRVTVNLCVNELSYRSLAAYPALMRDHGIAQLHVDIVRPASVGQREDGYLRSIMPRYSAMAPYLSEMLARFQADDPDFDVNVGNLPYCMLPEWTDRIHHGGQETITQASDEGGLEPQVDKYAWHASQRRHVPACATCAVRERCTGVFTEYLELYGDSDFRPVSLETLARSGQAFALRVAPHLQPVTSAALPFGFARVPGAAGAERDGRVRAHVRAPSGAALELTFEAPGRALPVAAGAGEHDASIATVGNSLAGAMELARTPILVTSGYQLRVSVGTATPSEVGQFLRWVADVLEGARGRITLVEALDVPRAVERLLAPEALRRGAARLDRLVEHVESLGPLVGFSFAGTRALDDDAPGAYLRMARADGAAFELVLALGTRGGRSQVSVDVRLLDGTDVETARPAVDALLGAIEQRRVVGARAG